MIRPTKDLPMLELHPTLALGGLALIAIASLLILFELNGGESQDRTDP